MTECPKCKSTAIVAGHLALGGETTRGSVTFVPASMKWYQVIMQGAAALKSDAFACTQCNLVWASVAYPDALQRLVEMFPQKK